MPNLKVRNSDKTYNVVLEPYTYIGAGVDSGQNERDPYFDFDGLPAGMYLCKHGNQNLPTDTCGFTIVYYAINYSGNGVIETYTPSIGPFGPDPSNLYVNIFRMDSSYPARLYGVRTSWGANIYVWRINNLPF